jgi:hypothetical protein
MARRAKPVFMSEVSATDHSKSAAEAAPERVGVLLVNLGTPDTADAPGVRVYLKEFLSDPRVIENQGLFWKLVLNGIILRTRPAGRRSTIARSGTTKKTSHRSRPSRAHRPKNSLPISQAIASWSTGGCAMAIPPSSHGSMR